MQNTSRPLYNILIKISSKNGKGVIIICKICGQYICPSSCPEFSGYVPGIGISKNECFMCGVRIYEDDEFFKKNGKVLCKDCAEELISQELLDFLDCTDVTEFFDMLL